MVNGIPFEIPELPPFPTLFGEEEAERLRGIEEQRKRMEEVYRGKFTPEQWAKVPLPERAVRRLLPPWVAPIAKVLTPWEWGWEFGYTPEQAEKERLELEEEYKELVRRERVTRLLPSIKGTLRALALSDVDMVTDIGELRSIFKLDELGYTEEEAGYISEFAQRLIRATPEEIVSGEVFEMPPLTQEEVDELARTAREPRQVLTTVALSKNLEDITAALQEMYAPQVVDDTRREAIIKEFAETLAGATKEGTEEAFRKIAEEEGEVLILTDTQTGTMVSASKRPDNTVWVEEELIGYYNVESASVVPIDPLTGIPSFTEEEQESTLKDLWDSFYLGIHQAWYGTKQSLFSIIPQAILQQADRPKEVMEGAPTPEAYRKWKKQHPGMGVKLTPEEEYALKSGLQRDIEALQANYNLREAEFAEWMKEHPELIPRPEYTQDPFEHPELFKDPYYYAYTIISNAPIIGAALLVGIGTTMATKSPFVGAVAGAAVITPTQINSVYEDLIANGADPANAAEMATSVGMAIGAVEILPGMIVLKVASPAFMSIFRLNLQKELARQVVRQLSIKGILLTAGKIEIAETLEEVIQESMQNAAVKTVNENRGILDNLPQTAVNAAIATAPLAFLGGGAQYVNMRANLSQPVREEIDATKTKMEEAGLSPEHAEAVAVSKVMETETGQAEIQLAVEKADEQIPDAPVAKASKIESLETKLTATNEDIETFENSLAIQEERLTKTTLPTERAELTETIDGMRESISELEIQKTRIEKQLKKQKKAAVPVVPEVPLIEELQTEYSALITQAEQVAPTNSAVIKAKDIISKITPENRRQSLIQIEALEDELRGIVTPEVVAPHLDPRRMTGLPREPETREETLDRRPRIQDWEDEQETVTAAMEANPTIANAIQLDKKVIEFRALAERTWNEATEEQRKGIRKEAHLSKSVIAKDWSDMTPPEQQALALTAIPDRSIHFPIAREIFDIRYYMQYLQEETGMPFYEIFKRAELSHGAARIVQEKFLQRIGTDPYFTPIRSDDVALMRVAQEINSRNPALKIESPEGLTDSELMLANVLEDGYHQDEPKVRYLRVMHTNNTMEALKAEFPDAPEQELAFVFELRKLGNLDDLWGYLQDLNWGVIGSGYDPWMASYPTLIPRKLRIGTTRGAARLMRRESIEFSELKMERNVLLRRATYMKQLEAQWGIEPELSTLSDMWEQAGVKFSNVGQIESALREWTRELQGIPTRNSLLDAVVRRVWRQSMGTIFVHIYMAVRNFHQHIAFHPDRTELARIRELPAAVKEKAGIYFDGFVSQLKGIRRDWLYTGEKGIPIPGLGALLRLADRFSQYPHSDNIPRRWTFLASLNKARRATEQFRRDNDISRWLRDSGVVHLRQTERNYALQRLAMASHDLAIPGLREVSGDEMVSLYIGHEVANMTHFIYERAFRAPVEYGATGRTLYNLIVFPRGYFQRLFFQAQKLPNLRSVFGPEVVNWEQARAGFKDVILLLVVGEFISTWLRFLTGRKRRSYAPLEIIQWELGGLAVGAFQDLQALLNDVWVVLDPGADDVAKEGALNRIPGELTRGAQTQVPFYRYLIDGLDAVFDTRNIEVQYIRKLRAILDESYTPEELEEIDRNTWEKLRLAILGGDVVDPTVFEQIQIDLMDNQERLGEMDARGNFYTLRQFGGQVSSSTKPLPDAMLTEEYGFSELTVFYKDCEDLWKELYKLPSSPASIRQEWRASHIEEEAMLLFWGKFATSVFRLGTPEWEQVSSLLRTWFSYHEIDARMHSKYADWTLPRDLTTVE